MKVDLMHWLWRTKVQPPCFINKATNIMPRVEPKKIMLLWFHFFFILTFLALIKLFIHYATETRVFFLNKELDTWRFIDQWIKSNQEWIRLAHFMNIIQCTYFINPRRKGRKGTLPVDPDLTIGMKTGLKMWKKRLYRYIISGDFHKLLVLSHAKAIILNV